ncbi:MAG: glycoside hydrolase family 3 protein [Bacteroidia bacterium]
MIKQRTLIFEKKSKKTCNYLLPFSSLHRDRLEGASIGCVFAEMPIIQLINMRKYFYAMMIGAAFVSGCHQANHATKGQTAEQSAIEQVESSKTTPQEKAKTVSLAEKIGQMVLVGFRGLTIDEKSFVVKDIKAGRVGGVILFDYDVLTKNKSRNIQSPEQVKTLINQLKSYSNIPLFISIDQEGGKVMRLKPTMGFPNVISPQKIGAYANVDTSLKYAEAIGMTLEKLGVNVNFAPCVDVNINPDCPVIGKIERAYSKNPTTVTDEARILINTQKNHNVLSVLKHFPGHGSAKSDSHLGVTDVSTTWQNSELLPYENLIRSGNCDAVMVAHVFNKNLDPKYPATLSAPVIKGLLREKLEFNGLVFSDDMQMRAITSQYGVQEAVRRFILAGGDVLVFGNNLEYDENVAANIIKTISSMVKKGEISEARIDESYARILKAKGIAGVTGNLIDK